MKKQRATDDKLRIEGIGAKGFGIIPKYAMRDPDLGCWSKLVYAYLCSLSGSGNQTWPRRETILRDLDIGKNTYYSAQKELTSQGYITIHQSRQGNRQGTNIYTLIACPEKIKQQHKSYTKNKTKDVNRVISSGLKAGGYGMLPRLVMQDGRLWPKAKLVYAYLASYAGAGCVAFPSNQMVIAELQLNRRAWQRSVRELSVYGYLKVIQRRSKNGRYDICDYCLLDTPVKTKIAKTESAKGLPEVTFEDAGTPTPEVIFEDTEKPAPEVTFEDTESSPEVTLREAQNQDAESSDTSNNLVTVLSSNNLSICKSGSNCGTADCAERQDRKIDYEGTKRRLEEQLEMSQAEQIYGKNASAAKELFALLVDVLSSPDDTFQLGNQHKPKAPLWELTPEHLLYVIESIEDQQQKQKIYNPRSYRLAALYHAPETIGSFKAAHDYEASQLARKEADAEDWRQYILGLKKLGYGI